MKAKKFPTSLFDFDFTAEAEAKRFHDTKIAVINATLAEERRARLSRMSRRALDEDRMPAYFRIQDSLDNLKTA